MMGLLLPRVAGYREGSDSEGGKVRQQASNLCDLAVKYHLTQQVVATREKEILDLVWSSNPDLVSCIQVDTFPDITDHSVVTTTTSLRLENKQAKNKEFLLKSGKRFRQLDFAKDPWPEIQSKLRQVELGPIQDLAKTNVTAAHSLFNLLPVNIRNENSGDFPLFKNHLDICLSMVPDQPTTPGLVRAAESNSLLDQVPLVPHMD